jgi:hypothetical protein
VHFPNFHAVWTGDIALPFTRGHVDLMAHNHATMKYWVGSAWLARWDNIGFDGPVVTNWREYSAPDSLTVTHGIAGCRISGTCQWRGRVIAEHPEGGTYCTPETDCAFDGEGRNVGYAVPNVQDGSPPSAPPARVEIPGVRLDGATRARLAFGATYPYFEWNGRLPPVTTLNLRYRVNGGAWHDRFINAVEANAFGNRFAELGDVAAVGVLNQTLELDLAELHDGANVVEFYGAGTWTGSYSIGVIGVDLVLTTGH